MRHAEKECLPGYFARRIKLFHPIQRLRYWSPALLLLLSVSSAPSHGADDLAAKLQPLIDQHQGNVAVAIKHLPSGESFQYRADEPMPTASLIKFPLMIAAYQQVHDGRLQLEQMVEIAQRGGQGSGIRDPNRSFFPGMQMPLRDAIQLMIVYSDNTATNLVIDLVGLPATALLMEQLDCPHTKLHSKVFRRDTSIFPDRSRQFGLGSTTAAEQLRLWEKLWNKQLVSEQASEDMLRHLRACDDKVKIGRYLPADAKFPTSRDRLPPREPMPASSNRLVAPSPFASSPVRTQTVVGRTTMRRSGSAAKLAARCTSTSIRIPRGPRCRPACCGLVPPGPWSKPANLECPAGALSQSRGGRRLWSRDRGGSAAVSG